MAAELGALGGTRLAPQIRRYLRRRTDAGSGKADWLGRQGRG